MSKTGVVALTLMALALSPASATAAPPTIERTLISAVSRTSARLEADLNLQGNAVSYRFEYGPGDCSINACAAVPGGEGEVKPGEPPKEVKIARVKAPLAGLEVGTTYHFRVVATSGSETLEGLDRTFTTFGEASIFSACPNEAFRLDEVTALNLGLEAPSANLPDCRAFEQATPINKNAGDATATVPYAKANADGGGVTFISKSGIPGGVGAQEFPSYLASRGGGDWSTQGLLPAATEGQAAQLLGWTPDFSEIFTKATRFGSPSEVELLAKSGTSGATLRVVDYTVGLNPKFAATSEDGSLLFESPVKLATGAVPGRPNVYLWAHGSGKVSLAGVLNDGSAPSQGAIAGPYDWIRGTNSATLSQGGGARDYYTEDEHALARDGSAVFFTAAGSGKLYERLNPGEEQSLLDGAGSCTEPTKACTVNVSASHKENGSGSGGSELGSPRPAAFQAASADGKVVYFTSQEELTNDANTGPEPTVLPPPAFISRVEVGAGEVEETDIEREFLPVRASSLASDPTYLYWADREAGAIGRVKLDGTEPADPAFITGLAGIEDVAVGGGHLYWTEPTNNTIGRADIDGSSASVKSDFIGGASAPKGVAVGGGFVYWTNEEGHSVGRALEDGTGVKQKFIDFNGEPAGEKVPRQGIAVDAAAGHIYVALGSVYIRSYELNGEKDPQEITLSELAGDVDLSLDGSHLYWNYEETAGLKSLISRAKLDLSDKEEEFIKEKDGVELAQSVAVEGGHLYWANDPPPSTKPGNDLYRYEVGTGALEDLSADSSGNGGEAQGVLGASKDGSVVYFVANGDLDESEVADAGNCAGKLSSMSGECSIYRWEKGGGEPSLVARVDVGGDENKTDAANWAATPTGVYPNGNFQKTAQVSADGEALLFRSQRQLGAYPNEGIAELYLYRTGMGLTCVSCAPSGAAPLGTPDLGNISPGTSTIPPSTASFVSRNLAAGGQRVFFETPDALVASDTNGEPSCPRAEGQFAPLSCLDIYEWEAVGTGSCEQAEALAGGGCIYLISTGKGKEPAVLADASESGGDVFFFSRARLVGQDKDELMDVYDARVEGGLAVQNPPAPPVPCESVEACHGPPSPAPAGTAPVTPSFYGPGNIKPSHKAHKGKNKKKKHRKAHIKRRAGR